MIGLSDDALFFHALHDGGSAVVADLKAALDIGRRGLAIPPDNGNGLLVKVAPVREAHSGRVKHGIAVFILVAAGGHFFKIFWRTLRFEMPTNLLDLVFRYEWSVHAANAPAASHKEHIALAEQLLGALLAEDGAAVNLRGHLERDAGREVRLDGTGDHVNRRALGRQNDVNARCACHLRQALDGALDVFAGDRSEEHTSELQSLRHLVCRLLL